MSREWSFFTAVPTKMPGGGWLSTMPMVCPSCGLDWNPDGLSLRIRGNVDRSWGASPAGGATVFYTCLGCGHRAYDDKKAEYRRRPAATDEQPVRWGRL